MTRRQVLDQMCDLIAGGLGRVPKGEEALLLRELGEVLTIMAVSYEARDEDVDGDEFKARLLATLGINE